MRSFAFIILLSGIIAAHAVDLDDATGEVKELISQVKDKFSEVVENFSDKADDLTEAASDFIEKVQDVIEEVNGDIDDRLTDLNDTLRSKIEDAVSSFADGAPDSVSDCLSDKEDEIADFIASRAQDVLKCVSDPITSITKSIQTVAVAADVAAKAANVYANKIEDCTEDENTGACLAKAYDKARSAYGDLDGTIFIEISSIGLTITNLKEDIDDCISDKRFLVGLHKAAIEFSILRCQINKEAGDDDN